MMQWYIYTLCYEVWNLWAPEEPENTNSCNSLLLSDLGAR
jgi:hypothetical protein